MPRPNVLLIMSDQHGARWTGCYGDTVVRTPHIDRLAREGVLFENAYCHSPICVPSRLSFLTGRRLQDIRIWDNNTVLPAGADTWPRAVRNGGYECVLDGKMHIAGPDRLQGFGRQLSQDVEDRKSMPVPDWKRGTVPDAGFPLFENGFAAKPDDYRDVDDDVAEQAVHFLSERRNSAEPWVLVAGFHGPHPKWYVEHRYLDLYPPETLEPPAQMGPELRNQNPIHRRSRAMRGIPEDGYPLERILDARRHYFAKITRVDERIGVVLDALDRFGLSDDTIVVYTSDHGEMVAEHGLWNKHCFYEESAAVPLIVRCPSRWKGGERRAEIVSLLDLSATLFDLGDGRSSGDPAQQSFPSHRNLFTLLDEAGDSPAPEPLWRGPVLGEYYATWVDRPMAMLRKNRYKLVYSHGDPPELFDIATDRREHNDLSANPEYSAVLHELTDELLSHWDPEKLHSRIVESQQWRLAKRDRHRRTAHSSRAGSQEERR